MKVFGISIVEIFVASKALLFMKIIVFDKKKAENRGNLATIFHFCS